MSDTKNTIEEVSTMMKDFNLSYTFHADENGNLPDVGTATIEAIERHTTIRTPANPDILHTLIAYPKGAKDIVFGNDEGKPPTVIKASGTITLSPIAVRFLVNGENIAFESNGQYIEFGIGTGKDAKDLLADVKARNIAAGWQAEDGFQTKKETALATQWPMQTSQELTELNRAICDGRTGTNWTINHNAGTLTHEIRVNGRKPSHITQMTLTDTERDAGIGADFLLKVAQQQNADNMMMFFYIVGAIMPQAPLAPRTTASGWIDFDDVIKKIGWTPRNTKDRREMHKHIWNFLKFGERATVIGDRKGHFKDDAGNTYNTTINDPIWRTGSTETLDKVLFEALNVPVGSEVIFPKSVAEMMQNTDLAQYLQGAEILCRIPGGKVAGAWARVIGTALMEMWRIYPQQTIQHGIKTRRRDLLERYKPALSPVSEVLESDNPGRAIKYFYLALETLQLDHGFIEKEGEAAKTLIELKSEVKGKHNWQHDWLNTEVLLFPGKNSGMYDHVRERAKALPPKKPRNLKAKPHKEKKP